MNILYCYKGDGDFSSVALRFSLRSVDRHMANVDRVALVGTGFPDWLRGEHVDLVPCAIPYRRKQQNLLFEMLSGLKTLGWGPCLCSSDDHICTFDCDADRFPWYCNGALPSKDMYIAQGKMMTPYRASLAATHDLLETKGYPFDLKMSGHVNTHVDSGDVAEVEALAGDYGSTKWGYEPSELFAAVARRRDSSIKPVLRYDVKLMNPCSKSFIEDENGKGLGFISMSDVALLGGGDLLPWLLERFPGKSRWEA